ncbi:MAG TPA: HD domain-containing phosphohydrolase [Spirochaetia bacterium]|nr:HD domain-containing phosphohydrolase [Spirochaetia bacterium]
MKRDTQKLFRTIESLFTIKDLDSLLESILTEARHFVMADAGTIYLLSRENLYFSFVQNDTLFRGETKDKYVPSGASLPVDKGSLAGYVAKSGEPILIDDVYHIQSDLSFTFNPAFDQKTHYHTKSILGVPLKTRENEIVGVLQLINAKSDSGEVVAFSMDDKMFISQFAQHAADAIEKARLSREMVLRMVELAELRDPFETSQHAKRVGAYSVELYEKWATKRAVSSREIRKFRDVLRTAAILHDVGKVAISDTILKKPSQLTFDEKLSMKLHTVLGARLFRRATSFWDYVSAEVALNHHENWDGSGYPGRIDDLYADKIYLGPGKQGPEIPLSARVVSIADVYDALVSQRAYKDRWRQEHALHYIRYQAGKKFDPELVSIFLKMGDLLTAIHKKYEY